MDVSEIRRVLLHEMTATNERVDSWLESLEFGRPRPKHVADPTFKTLPLRYVEIITSHFMVRESSNLCAMLVLCREGLAVQAQPILRANLESAIDLRYISTNPQALITKWCLSEEALRHQYWRGMPEGDRPTDYGFGERSTANRLKLMERHTPKPNGKPWRLADLARDWDCSNLVTRDDSACATLGEPEHRLYDIYKLLCGNLHGGTQAANDFVVAHGDGKFEMVTGLRHRKLVFVPFFALYSIDVAIRAAERCGARHTEGLGPRWDSLGITAADLPAAASADFAYAPPSHAV